MSSVMHMPRWLDVVQYRPLLLRSVATLVLYLVLFSFGRDPVMSRTVVRVIKSTIRRSSSLGVQTVIVTSLGARSEWITGAAEERYTMPLSPHFRFIWRSDHSNIIRSSAR